MRLLAAFLLLLGITVMGYGIYGALMSYAGALQHAVDDPLGTPEVDEKTELPRVMLTYVGIGALGIVPLIAGGTILQVGLARRLFRASRKREEADVQRAAQRDRLRPPPGA